MRRRAAFPKRSMSVATLVCAGLLALVVLLPGTALAGVTHPFLFSFDGSKTPDGALRLPAGSAINQTNHDVYVIDINGGPTETGAVDVFNAAGGYLSQITGSATPQGSFGDPRGIAVNSTSGHVYVADGNNSVIDVFDGTGKYLTQFENTGAPTHGLQPFNPVALTVDGAGDLYAGDVSNNVIDKFSAAGAYLAQISLPAGSPPLGLAAVAGEELYVMTESSVLRVDALGNQVADIATPAPSGIGVDASSGNLFVAHATTVSEYDPLGGLVSSFGPPQIGEATGVSVATGSGDLYVTDHANAAVEVFGPQAPAPDATTGEVSVLTATGATLSGTVNPASKTLAASYQFEYGESATYGSLAPASPTSIGTGETPHELSAAVTGLQPNTTYHYRMVAYNANGRVEGSDRTFTTPGPPGLGSESISNVGVGEATLHASVDPHGLDTHYFFQYGTDSNYALGAVPAAPGKDLGEGEGAQAVIENLAGLAPETEYHVRVVATSSEGIVYGTGTTFKTFPLLSSLPDGRGYEMVSPVDKEDGNAYSTGGLATPGNTAEPQPFQSSTDGDSFVYAGDPSSGGNGILGNEYLATRGAAGWSARDISPATAGPSARCPQLTTTSAPFTAFSPDLSVGELITVPSPQLSALTGGPACYAAPFLRQNATNGYSAIITSAPANRLPAEFGFGLQPRSGANAAIIDASSDLSHVFFGANDALVKGSIDGGVERNNLYESVNGKLSLVNILPEGVTEPGATLGSAGEGNAAEPPDVTHAVSTDGSRVFWTDLNAAPTKLLVRENGIKTVQLDAPQGGSGEGGGGRFWTASATGSKVFFTDAAFAGLTEDTVQFSGNNLYEYNVESGKLTDITGGQEAPRVEGVVGASEDGSYVYFVATGVLGDGATAKPAALPEEPNLYVWHAGQTRFIATLAPQDNANSTSGNALAAVGDWRGALGYTSARVTPDGLHLVFQSVRSLTGYPNEEQPEVYLYSAQPAALTCASCSPTGLPATHPSELRVSQVNAAQPRWVSDDGSRVIFDSDEALSSSDTNETWDVYEYEAGHIHLISDGLSHNGSFFDDASPSGDDVFFTTRARLVREDQDEETDIYDARVGGGFAPAVPATPCQGEACRGPQPPPPTLTPAATVSFTSLGSPAQALAPKVAAVKVSRKAIKGRTIALSVKVPAKGKITVSGVGATKLARSVSKTGTYTLSVHLTKRAAGELSRKHKLTVTLRIAYAPSSGNSSSAKVTVRMTTR
jgi:hypothetical protein